VDAWRWGDEEERGRLWRIFDKGHDRIVGSGLTLARSGGGFPRPSGRAVELAWASGRWFFRSGHLFLILGDSPLGYRLPLESLPWIPPEEYPEIHEKDPFASLPLLAPQQSYVHGAP